MLSECDHPTNLTRYHNLPHLNLESRISSTSYSSWPLIDGDRAGLWRLQMLSNFIQNVGADTREGYDRVDVFLLCGGSEVMVVGEMTFVMVKGPAPLWSSFFIGQLEE